MSGRRNKYCREDSGDNGSRPPVRPMYHRHAARMEGSREQQEQGSDRGARPIPSSFSQDPHFIEALTTEDNEERPVHGEEGFVEDPRRWEKGNHKEPGSIAPGAFRIVGNFGDSTVRRESISNSDEDEDENEHETIEAVSPPDETPIIEAHAVKDPPLVHAQLDDPRRKYRNKYTYGAVGVAAVAVLILILVLVLVLFQDDGGDGKDKGIEQQASTDVPTDLSRTSGPSVSSPNSSPTGGATTRPSSTDPTPFPSVAAPTNDPSPTPSDTQTSIPTDSPTLPVPRWIRYGDPLQLLLGRQGGDGFGSSVAVSRDGSTFAVGAPQSCYTCTDRNGLVKVFQMTSDGGITPFGQTLTGDFPTDNFGRSLTLSSGGRTLAVGADQFNSGNGFVRAFRYNGTAWNPFGTTMYGAQFGDRAGFSVTSSEDGQTLAIGSVGNGLNGAEAGQVRVFRYTEKMNNWDLIGQSLYGDGQEHWFGQSVALSGNGTILAIGAGQTFADQAGYVRTLRYNGTRWNEVAPDLVGDRNYDQYGASVSLSRDGSILAVGASEHGDIYAYKGSAGLVRVYEYNGGALGWNQLGQDVLGESASDFLGGSVSLSSDGRSVAAGAAQTLVNANDDPGYVVVYEYEETTSLWEQVGETIRGKGVDDWLGDSVSLSGDGDVLGIGASQTNTDTTRSVGEAHVYKLLGG